MFAISRTASREENTAERCRDGDRLTIEKTACWFLLWPAQLVEEQMQRMDAETEITHLKSQLVKARAGKGDDLAKENENLKAKISEISTVVSWNVCPDHSISCGWNGRRGRRPQDRMFKKCSQKCSGCASEYPIRMILLQPCRFVASVHQRYSFWIFFARAEDILQARYAHPTGLVVYECSTADVFSTDQEYRSH